MTTPDNQDLPFDPTEESAKEQTLPIDGQHESGDISEEQDASQEEPIKELEETTVNENQQSTTDVIYQTDPQPLQFGSDAEIPDNQYEASTNKRFLNHLIDSIFYYVFSFAVGGAIGLIMYDVPGLYSAFSWFTENGKLGDYALGIIIVLLFYIFFESVFEVTPGKILTKTRVVSENGGKAPFLNIVGRTFVRLIPFDAFSFFGASRGFHDRFSKTKVIEDTTSRKILIPSILAVVILSFSGFMYSMTFLNKEDTEIASSETVFVSYRDISFDCKENWKVEKAVLSEDMNYQIACEMKGSKNLESMVIVAVAKELDTEDWLKKSIVTFKDIKVYQNAEFGSIVDTTFLGRQASFTSFNGSVLGDQYCGELIAFVVNGKSLLYLKQARDTEKLHSSFSLIESSMKVE